MKSIHLHQKTFNHKDIQDLVVGGQNQADTIRFVIPKFFAGEVDLSTWDWYVQYRNKEGQGDMVLLQAVQSEESADNLWIDWCPSETATAVSGKLDVQVFASKNRQRFTCVPFSIYIPEWLSPEEFTPGNPTIIEQALELMEYYAANVEEALKQGEIAKKWATQMPDPVEGDLYSSRKYAQDASSSASSATASKNEAAASASTATTKASEAVSSASAAKTSESNAAASAKSASDSKTAAAQSASSASSSASSASSSATNASNSASTATTAASTAISSASAAKTSETNAAASAKSASDSKTAAAQAATSASSSASSATTSRNEAAASANTATTKASEAASSASAAKTSETNAAASAKSALDSETAAAKSATSASSSANSATSSKNTAVASASTASTKATEAANSATAAKQSEDNASSSASEAKKQADRAQDIADNIDTSAFYSRSENLIPPDNGVKTVGSNDRKFKSVYTNTINEIDIGMPDTGAGTGIQALLLKRTDGVTNVGQYLDFHDAQGNFMGRVYMAAVGELNVITSTGQGKVWGAVAN